MKIAVIRTHTEGESDERGEGERRASAGGPGGISQILQKRFGGRDRLLVNVRFDDCAAPPRRIRASRLATPALIPPRRRSDFRISA